MNNKTKQIISEIQKYKGENFAVLCAVEEMSELIKALTKSINRGKNNHDKIFEEVADVMIVLEHIKIIYDLRDQELFEYINKKMPEKWSHKIEQWKVENES